MLSNSAAHTQVWREVTQCKQFYASPRLSVLEKSTLIRTEEDLRSRVGSHGECVVTFHHSTRIDKKRTSQTIYQSAQTITK